MWGLRYFWNHLLAATGLCACSDPRLHLQRTMLEIPAIILLHDPLSHLLSLEIDEAIRRVASRHWVDSDIDSLNTSKHILKQLLHVLGGCLIWHVTDIQTTAFINCLLCL